MGYEFIGQLIVVLLFPVTCFYMGTLNKKCKSFDLWLVQEWLVAGQEGRHMRRAVSFAVLAAVDMVQHCQVFGRSRSLTWGIDCSVLAASWSWSSVLCLVLKCVE